MDINTFSYGGIDSSEYGITCSRETHSILPEQRKYVKDVTYMDGTVDFGIGGYGVRVMTVDVYFYGDYFILRANREKIIAWLANYNGTAKQLIFGNDPTKYYLAKTYVAIQFENTTDGHIGSIQFEANPPWQYSNGILLTPAQISWNTTDLVIGNQYVKDFTASGSVRLTNAGTMSAKPIIKLIGNIPSGLMLSYNGAQWQYNASILYDGIKIDCNAQTVTRISDGVNLFGNVSLTKYAYFNLAPGQIEIFLTASGLGVYPLNLTMIVEFNPQYMG